MAAPATLVAVLLTVFSSCAFAQSAESRFPVKGKGIRVVIPYPPGGGNDAFGRLIVNGLNEGLAPGSVADNRGGAGTVIGTEIAARANADGHTLLVVSVPFVVLNGLYPEIKVDAVRDFAPVIKAGSAPSLLVVNPSTPYRSVKDLLAAAKAKPDGLVYGSSGSGSSTHLFMELLKYLTKTSIVHVPYKGGANTMTALLSGEVPVMFANLATVGPQVKAGRMRAIATTAARRNSAFPDVPTMSEAGVPGFQGDTFWGLVAPAGVPRSIVDLLNKEVNRILTADNVRRHFDSQGIEVVGGSAESFGVFLKSEVALWSKLLKEVKIKAE